MLLVPFLGFGDAPYSFLFWEVFVVFVVHEGPECC